MGNNIKKNHEVLAVLFIPLSIVLGMVMVELLFRQGPFFIILFSIPLAIIVGLPSVLIIFLLQRFINPLRQITFPIMIGLIMFLTIVVMGKLSYSPSPLALLERFLPINSSTSISKVNGVIEYPGY